MSKLFDNIADKNKNKIIKNLRIQSFHYSSKTIIKEIDDDDIIAIESGSLSVVKNNYNGTINIIEEYREGDIISSLNIYLNDNSISLVALEDLDIILLSNTTISNIDINDKLYGQFLKNIFMMMNESIKAKNERIDLLSKKSTRDKLFCYFNRLSVKSHSRNIYLSMSLSNLANFLCVDRSAMSRELSYLKQEGFISVKGRRITLLYR